MTASAAAVFGWWRPRASARQRQLGQNFLVDRNILDVIERLARSGPGDVVLEIGGGAGVLSERLAPRVAHLHVVELDRGLEVGLRRRSAPFDHASSCTSATRLASTWTS